MRPDSFHILDLLEGIIDASNPQELAERSIDAVAEVIGGDYYSAICCTMDYKQIEVFHPGEGWLGKEAFLFQGFAELHQNKKASIHPSTQAFLQSGQNGAYLRSQLMQDRIWYESEHYQVIDRELGIRDMATLFIRATPDLMLTLNCGRHGGFKSAEMDPLVRLERVMTPLLQSQIQRKPLNNQLLNRLSTREKEILHWVHMGKRNIEIATILSLSKHTVRKHLENIFNKLEVETRFAAARTLEE